MGLKSSFSRKYLKIWTGLLAFLNGNGRGAAQTLNPNPNPINALRHFHLTSRSLVGSQRSFLRSGNACFLCVHFGVVLVHQIALCNFEFVVVKKVRVKSPCCFHDITRISCIEAFMIYICMENRSFASTAPLLAPLLQRE
ncbi:uncharacterized protein LOC116024280 [Ipomoea triloba]|uniref:uncharacterized protein LOC116024280 n=1 Tax=Ipomoea triloba TaxID=35885 RepID=UPI00125DE8BC|nr:uncharacterized protein LOC116024280 [Ipomoea triloba]